jgi:alpha-beta hydrolase superfamily lysophospholipase
MRHFWFSSGNYSLLGHLHLTASLSDVGMVMVSPHGWEDICSYRPMRAVAEYLAQHGIPTLRYDLPGTGDSSGSPEDERLFDAWAHSVNDAVVELKAQTGVSRVIVFGIRMGALIALTASDNTDQDCVQWQDLVLWGPSTGRALLRELAAFRKLETAEGALSNATVSSAAADELENAGFILSKATAAKLHTLDFDQLNLTGRRLLVLSRDQMPVEAKLLKHLQASGAEIQQAIGMGYQTMMEVPHQVVPPLATADLIQDWLPISEQRRSGFESPLVTTTAVSLLINESIFSIPSQSGTSFGVLSEPYAKSESCVVFLNPGATRHIGPNRMWVEAARRFAAQGLASLRVDFEGIGESDGRQNLDVQALYHDSLCQQVGTTLKALSERTQYRSFILVGLCSGAMWAFHGAANSSQVAAAVMINPRLFFWDPEVDRRREQATHIKGVNQASGWKKLASGKLSWNRIVSGVQALSQTVGQSLVQGKQTQIPQLSFARTLRAIQQNNCKLSMVFSDGEPLLQELEQEGYLPSAGFELTRAGAAGHTFRPVAAQRQLHALLDQQLAPFTKRPATKRVPALI